ncbi:MAG: hypothetical protein GY854_08520 [Deltaproteobacteria bacterium]|nr:hypothetical protein [Deltaproteobacteria bacterium]
MSGISATPWKAGKKKHSDKEWDELGRKVEHKVMREVRKWADENTADEPGADQNGDAETESRTRAKRDEEWNEIGCLVEEKIKRKVRKWAEED